LISARLRGHLTKSQRKRSQRRTNSSNLSSVRFQETSSLSPYSFSSTLTPIHGEILSRTEFARKLDIGILIPSRLVQGRTYRLRLGEKINVFQDGRPIGYLCVSTTGVRDSIDECIALYLNLVLNENGLLKSANLHQVPPRVYYGGRDTFD